MVAARSHRSRTPVARARPARPAPPAPPAALLNDANLRLADLDRFKIATTPAGYPDNVRTFYSPIDWVHQVLETVLSCAARSIVVAMYGFDDDDLASMLATALHDPAMYVQITLDKTQAAGKAESALLKKYFNQLPGNSIAIGHSEKGAIMHRKMMIIDGVWRISGSTNWSDSGETKQDNELTVIRDATVCAEARTILDVEHDAVLKQMAAASKA